MHSRGSSKPWAKLCYICSLPNTHHHITDGSATLTAVKKRPHGASEMILHYFWRPLTISFVFLLFTFCSEAELLSRMKDPSILALLFSLRKDIYPFWREGGSIVSILLWLWTEPEKEQSPSSIPHPHHQVSSQLLSNDPGHLHSHKYPIFPADYQSSVLTTALEKCSYDRVHNAQGRKLVHVLIPSSQAWDSILN